MTGSEGEERRKNILAKFSLPSIDDKKGGSERLQLESHHLVEGKKINYIDDGEISSSFPSRFVINSNRYRVLLNLSRPENPNLNDRIPIWEWMKSIRKNEEPVASFYFPDNLAGPDILFSLESSERDSRILCVLQVNYRPSSKAKDLLTFVRLKS